MNDQNYIFTDTQDQAEFNRLRKIEQAFDPSTKQILEKYGLCSGMKCLEIGPGAGSIAEWMCEKVGVQGHVSAMDLNVRFISQLTVKNLTVIHGDITKENFPENVFDCIHARYVFIHIHEYKSTISKLIKCLKPGGLLLLEEPDFSNAKADSDDPQLVQSFNHIHEAIALMYRGMKLNPAFGSQLVSILKDAGLQNIQNKIIAEKVCGGSLVADMMRMSTMVLKEKYLQTGAVTEEDFINYCELSKNSKHQALYYSSVSSWGIKSK